MICNPYEQQIKDNIARLRHEAKRFREYAKAHRQEISNLKRRPMGSRDPISELRALSRLHEYVASARDRDTEIKKLRATLK